MELEMSIKKNIAILALGAESAGNFSVYQNGAVYFSEDFGDLLEIDNFNKYKAELGKIIKNKKINPDIILTDLHPDFLTTQLGKELAKKHHAKHISVQHHLAHIFSAIGDQVLHSSYFLLPSSFFGVALDGTGYGLDEKIWGGEVFLISNFSAKGGPTFGWQFPISKQMSNVKCQITRIGHLENQIMLGGELAIREPARMLIGILDKVFSAPSSPFGRGCPPWRTGEGKDKLQKKNNIYNFVKKYYSRNKFELLYNQLQQNFNCVETSSTGRILDAVSLLLDFCENKRNYKHEPAFLLEANSTKPYDNLKPRIIETYNEEERSKKKEESTKFNAGSSVSLEPHISEKASYILQITPLFEYLIKNISKDKKRLAATAQLYIAQGLYELICHSRENGNPVRMPTDAKLDSRLRGNDIFLSGGISNNKIIANYFESKNICANKKTCPAKLSQSDFSGIPRGDAGISFGQVVYFLLNN